jgi:type II secretory pathway pseudopilin PulG
MPGMMVKLPALPKREGTKVPRSQTERLWLIGGGLVAFVLLLIGYFFFISPQRSQTSDVNSQVATAKQANAQLQHRLDALRQQNKNLPKYKADLAKARLALPATTGVPDFLRTLQALGNATNISVSSLTFGQPAPATVAAPVPTASPTQTATSTGSTATTAQPASPSAGVYSISITASASGTSVGLDNFLEQLQVVQPRAVLITQIAETASTPGPGRGTVTGTTTLQLTMQAFVAPAAAAPATAAATPSAGSS